MKSLDELKAIRERNQSKIGMRSENASQIKVVTGLGDCGIAKGAREVLTALSDAVQEEFLTEKVRVTPGGCIGLCSYEPVVEVLEPGKEKVTYVKMTPDKARKVFEEHLKHGRVVTEYTLDAVQEKEG